MAHANYQPRIATPTGIPLDILADFTSIDYTKIVNGIMPISVTVPYRVDPTLLQRDNQLQIARKPSNGSSSIDALGYITRWKYSFSRDGEYSTTISAQSPEILLARKINAYAAGETQSEVDAAADDALKKLVRENLGSSASGDRDISLYISIQPDQGLAPNIVKGYSWRNVLKVMDDIVEYSRQQGTELFYEMAVAGLSRAGISIEFRTYIDQPGRDLSNDVYFSPSLGNMDGSSLEFDFAQEINYVYAGGQGREANRRIQEASDSQSVNLSPFGRSEMFSPATNGADTDAAVLAAAREALSANRARMRFVARILSTDITRYNREWSLGDRVTAFSFDQTFVGIVRKVRVVVDSNGESIDARIEGDYPIT